MSALNVDIDGRFQPVNGLCYLWQQARRPDAQSVIAAGCCGKSIKGDTHINNSVVGSLYMSFVHVY